jgi:hypothetical protein
MYYTLIAEQVFFTFLAFFTVTQTLPSGEGKMYSLTTVLLYKLFRLAILKHLSKT